MISDKEFIEIVNSSDSIADICRKIGIKPVGGNYKTVKNRIKRLNCDISHYKGSAHRKGNFGKGRKGQPLEEILVKDRPFSSSHLRMRLIREGIKEPICEKCGLDEWLGEPITLELEHINGDNRDNRLENLEILCPNCHSQTKFWRGRNRMSALVEIHGVEPLKVGETLTQEGDGNPERSSNTERVETLREAPKICEHCSKEFYGTNLRFCSYECKREAFNTKPKVPELLEAFQKHKNYVKVGRAYGVSDNAVRKWVDHYGIADMVKRKSRAQTR